MFESCGSLTESDDDSDSADMSNIFVLDFSKTLVSFVELKI